MDIALSLTEAVFRLAVAGPNTIASWLAVSPETVAVGLALVALVVASRTTGGNVKRYRLASLTRIGCSWQAPA